MRYGTRTRPRQPGRLKVWPDRRRHESGLLLDDREHVAGREHQVLLARVLHFGAAVLAVQHLVADADIERDALARVVNTARANREDLALLGLLLRGVRDNQPGCGDLLCLKRLDHDTALYRLKDNPCAG